MNNKNTGIIATIASVLLCGCPGLFLCIFGLATALGAGTYSLGSDSGNLSPAVGYGLLCVSLILIAIPIVIGVVMLRKKPAAPVSNEPLPPAS
jgi:hypothetical protein